MKFFFVYFFVLFSFVLNTHADEDVLRPTGKPVGYYDDINDDDYEFMGLPFALGIEAGANYNMFSQNITYNPPLNQPLLQNYDNGTGLSPYFGFFADFSFNENIGLHIKLQYNQVYFENSGTGLVDGYVIDQFGNYEVTETSAEIDWSNEMSYFVLEPSLRINLTEKLFGLIGISAQIPISNIKQSEKITLLEDGFYYYDFENGTYSDQISSEYEADILKNKFGLNLSLGYRFNITNNIDLVPQIHFHYFPDKVGDDENYELYEEGNPIPVYTIDATDKQLHALRFSLALWFNL